MAKADPSRDYYGDLEVSPTADVQEIKKQYKKLALKYHPDRNPGKDQSEVNARFQVIQSAHEILSDPEQRRVYDTARVRQPGRFGSGVKGNPWANAGSQYPPPPRRNAPTARNPASGANKYRGFTDAFQSSSKAHGRDDTAEAKEQTYKAWENMRRPKSSQAQQPSSSKPEPRPGKAAGAPPTTPRTPSARQKQEAAFGNRRSGYYPRSPAPGDEPPASSKNYSTNHTANLFREAAAKAARERERERGEMKDNSGAFDHSLDPRQRTPYQTHGGEKTNPFDGVPVRAKSTREPARNGGTSPEKDYSDQRPRSSSEASPGMRGSRQKGRPSTSTEQPSSNGKSGSRARAKYPPADATHEPASSQSKGASTGPDTPTQSQSNGTTPIFEFASKDDMFGLAPKSRSPFMSSSAEGMSTRFTDDGGPYQFSAGSPDAEFPPPRRSKSSSRLGRQSPPKPASRSQQNGFANGQTASPAKENPPPTPVFDPNGWNEKFKPQDFVPQPSKTASHSPTRSSRSTSKKPKTRPTMGTAAMTNSSSEEELGGRRGRFEEPASMESPNAMDIDSPPREPENVKPQKPQSTPISARNIPVEPSKPEWRAGNAGQSKSRAKEAGARPTPYKTPTAGSEDTEEFRATFADWKNMAPFGSTEPGLKSFAGDLKANLPFESKPSEQIPIKPEPSVPRRLAVPAPPIAPPIPAPIGVNGIRPTKEVAQSYLREFQAYLAQWESWYTIIVNHFSERNSGMQRSRSSKGLGFLSDNSVKEQLAWMAQDKEVRAEWTRACNEHEKRLDEFLAVRKQL